MKNKTRNQYLEMIQPGNIVAFRFLDKMFSGKVIEPVPNGWTVQTKNGSLYVVEKDNIAWVKNGSYWPIGIYNALKYSNGAAKTN